MDVYESYMCVPTTQGAITLGAQTHSGVEWQQLKVTLGEQDFFQTVPSSWQPQPPVTEATLFSG